MLPVTGNDSPEAAPSVLKQAAECASSPRNNIVKIFGPSLMGKSLTEQVCVKTSITVCVDMKSTVSPSSYPRYSYSLVYASTLETAYYLNFIQI